MAKKDTKTENLAQTLDLLNRSLQLEYSLIVHYPRIASAIEDEKVRELTLALGSASIKHANVIADVISKLGGNPQWSIESFPEQMGIIDIFQQQLEKEKLALQLHQQSARSVPDAMLSDKFNKLARDEEAHIQVVEKILAGLAP